MNIRLNGKRYTDLNMLTGNIDPEVIAFLQEWYNEKEEVIGHTSGSTGKPKEIRLLMAKKSSIRLCRLCWYTDIWTLCLSIRWNCGIRSLLNP